MNTEIIRLEKTQINQATETFIDAFNQDPMFHKFLPKTGNLKDKISRTFWKAILSYCQPLNYVYTTPEIKGVAAWIAPGEFPLKFLRLLQLGFYKMPFQIGFRRLIKFGSLFSLIGEYHEKDMHQPHWYLLGLAVSSSYQGQGIGSLLIQPILKKADEEGLPCYLETTTERAVSFYQRNGFEVLRITEEPVKIWTMKREARKI